MKKTILALAAMGTALCMTASIHYVSPGANGDGTSWQNAMGDLQAAIDQSQAGDEVWVSAGTYRPDSLIRGNKPTSRAFFLKDGVSLYGGFAGTEASKDEREVLDGDTPYRFAHTTVLSADDDVPDVWRRAIADGTSYRYGWEYENDRLEVTGTHGNGTHVLFAANKFVNRTEIDGFTLTGANANIWQAKAHGGALYAQGNVHLRRCQVIENSAYFSAESSTDSNSYGGAVFLYSDGEATIEDCLFARNYCHSSYGDGYGGAVYARKCAISNCVFTDCVADNGGALYNNGGTVEHCRFDACYASGGGALFNNGSATDISVISCRGLLGGGIYMAGSGKVVNTTAQRNIIRADAAADACRPGYKPHPYPSPLGKGRGGCWNAAADAAADSANIGMVHHELETMTVLNTIYHEADGTNFERATSWRGVAIEPADTLAVLAASWALPEGSIFVDAGTVIAGFEVETDLAGNARIAGDTIDAGAYEYQPQPRPIQGDVTGDGVVDIADVNAVINIMLGKATSDEWRVASDVTADGTVDIADVNAVINIMLGK